jgi:response regulator RpfG family c-di-GMP phosphodiesterase
MKGKPGLKVKTRSTRPTLLLVDDEAQILSALKRSLRREGYEIVAVESAAAALRVLAERSVDAILSDHKMPGMSGVQLLERAAESNPDAIRMLITGWTQEIPPERLAEIGIRALVTKPWDDARLKATLRQLMGVTGKASRREADSGTPDRSSDYSLRR